MTDNYSFPSQKWPKNQTSNFSEFLFEKSQFGTQNIFPSHLRYVNLRTQEMFDNLVDLYARLFMSQWHHYKKLMQYSFPPPPGVPPHIYLARCYISFWFIDLYTSNRDVVINAINLCTTAFMERYQEQLPGIPHEYDSYLTLLNASIRPTHIKNALDNARYVPILAESINVNDPNPFGINNFTPEQYLLYGLHRIMKEKKCWCFTPLSRDANGRPWWLFDWHTGDRVCSWFPPEDNYNLEDLTLAFILGTACTPNLGVGDVDDWQFFAEGIVPRNPNPVNYNRVVDRRFYGSYEVRTMEIQTIIGLPTTLGEEAQEVDKQMPRFKLIDWVYHHRVVLEMDNHKRTSALRCIALD